MKVDDPRREDWVLLGLEPGAAAAEVQRAYNHRRALYGSDSLATYTLLSDDERQAILDRLEHAYQRIVAVAMEEGQDRATAEDEQTVEPALALAPDPIREPGAHLRYHRLHSGLSARHVSEETKIRVALIEILEAEDHARLPAPVYVRGFVIQYARLLGLADPEGIAQSYLSRMTADEEP